MLCTKSFTFRVVQQREKNSVISIMDEGRYLIQGPKPFELLPTDNLAQLFWNVLTKTQPDHVVMVSYALFVFEYWLSIYTRITVENKYICMFPLSTEKKFRFFFVKSY